ncbi:MAG TPA: EAL domain-containing protein [Acidimicrobiales bacterium]|nr:EAL domain-containing protein [Acidimicrobiales bacterium]
MTAGAVTAVSASDGFGPVDPSCVHRCELPPEVEAVLERGHSAIVNPDVGPLPMAGLPAHLSTRRLVVTPVFIGGRRAGLAVVAPANPVDQPERLVAACDALGSAVSVALDAAELSEQLLDERSGERFEAMIRHSSDIVMVLRSDSTIRFVSPSATRVLGWELEGVIDRPLTELVHPEDSERLAGALIAVVARPGVHAPFEFRARHSSGDWRFLEAIGTCLVDDAALGGVVINVRDATERVTLEHELTQQALHDGLTGLANRDLFLRRVDDAMDRADGTRFQVEILFVDLDDFKTVNDSLGHRVGDEVLVAVADKLRRCVRTADTVARFGGDEFAVLLADGWENCAVVAERIVEAMRVPVQVDGQHVTVLASVGLASSSTRTDASDLLRQADLAMYVAKTEGKARWVAFRPEMLEQFLDELQLERALRAAVADDRLEVHFQPIIDLATGAFTGAEALARWSDPELGPVPPTTFIPVAERSELIEIIGRFVLGRACRWASRWEQESGRTLSHIAVNVSARQLRGASLVNDVRSALAESGLVPDKLVLEITESMLIDEGDAVIVRLEALRRLGVRIAIDDFGTGYSSLSYLERLPVDVLKIDRAFIAGLLDPGERSLVPAILELARTLGLATVAEGVETGEHGRRLAELGCELAQGFHYSRPIPEGRVAEVVAGLRIAPAGGARRRRRGVTPTP